MEHPFGVRKGSWTKEEDDNLRKCIEKDGEGKWHQVPQRAGLNRCRKSCRLRWLNYLKPNIKRGRFEEDEIDLMIRLHNLLGNRWSLIAGRLPGRTANDVKNYWNTNQRKNSTVYSKTEIKGKAQDTNKINIFKPQPRTFSRNSPCLKGKASLILFENDVMKVDDGLGEPLKALEPHENAAVSWESLFAHDKECDQGTSVKYPQGEKVNDIDMTLAGEEMGQSLSVGDLFFDIELWNLFDTEEIKFIQ